MACPHYEILVCSGPVCGERRNSRAVYERLQAEIERSGLSEYVELNSKRCFGRCARGPNALVRECAPRGETSAPGGAVTSLSGFFGGGGGRHSAMYRGLAPSDAADLIREHIRRGGTLRRALDGPAPRAKGRATSAGRGELG